ncbi:HD domain-containing protein [bacterium]|nr:HD domain-containing protein [bacterium]
MTEEKRYLKEYQVGESFTGYFVIRSRELRTTRNDAPFLVLEFGDKSGRLSGIVWDNADRLFHDFEVGSIVKLQGRIEVYREQTQVAVKRIRNLLPEDVVDPEDFLPISSLDPEEALDKLLRYTEAISNDHLRELLFSFLEDDKFVKSFMRAPGGKLWHHNRIGGLIEHTLSVVRLCRFFGRFYPEVDKELLVTGAILHDIGKIEEFIYETHFDYTSRGRLVGHINLGAQWIAQHAAELENFPAELLDKVIHLVLSHQGKPEFGSPVKPATQEAFLLHYADDMDAQMDAIRRIRANLPDGERWKFVNLLERYIDLGENNQHDDLT